MFWDLYLSYVVVVETIRQSILLRRNISMSYFSTAIELNKNEHEVINKNFDPQKMPKVFLEEDQLKDRNFLDEGISVITEAYGQIQVSFLRMLPYLKKAEEDLTDKEFRVWLSHTPLNYSTSRKLIKIAKNEFIEAHKSELDKVSGWSALYEVALLKPEQLSVFEGRYLNNDEVSHIRISDVRGCRPQNNNKNQQVVIASFKIDKGLLDSKKVEEIHATLNQLELPEYVKVTTTKVKKDGTVEESDNDTEINVQ